MEGTHFVRFAKKAASRKRATKACLKCRRRKVRCDVTRTAQPCTNCRLDGDEMGCVVAPRGTSIPLRHERGPASPFRPYVPDCEDDHAAIPMSPPPDDGCDDANPDTNELQIPYGGNTMEHAQTSLPDPASYAPNQHHTENTQQTPLRSELKALYSSLPFLKALNIRDNDFSHLNSRGCLRVPAKPILDGFIRHYFLYVHPLLPLLNEADFWDSYDATDIDAGVSCSGTPVSMLLLQAMMFASCTFVPQESLQVLGFSSILEAKESFYTKAKLLYDYATDSDPISIAQAALLLTYWCPTFRSGPHNKANSRWLNVAVQHAKSCRAEKYETMSQARPEDRKRQNILKRVWWCCIIRDRIMPLCVRRNIQITRSHFDFNSNSPLGYDDLVDELDFSRVYNTATKHTLLITLERLTKLCVSLTDVLSLVYPTEKLPILDAQAHSTAFGKVQKCRRALIYWSEITQPPLAHKDLPEASGSSETSSVLFTNLIWIYFHASRVALYNYELHLAVVIGLTTPGATSSTGAQFLEKNRKDLRSATKGITDCFGRLHPLRLTRWLPSSAVACTALPLALHMLDMRTSSVSSPGEIWTHPGVAAKQSRLNVLIQAFRELHPKYDGVDSISKTIRYFMECTYLEQSTPHHSERTDVLARSPTCYLRLALTIDLSLSQDRLPKEDDFPTRLREMLGRTTFTMPIFFGPMDTSSSPQYAKAVEAPPAAPIPPTSESLSQWVEDDRSVHFALEMGLDVREWLRDVTGETGSVPEALPMDAMQVYGSVGGQDETQRNWG
ncbi:hypothetical protein ACJZ2D_015547 [Fusarium nematophilum]